VEARLQPWPPETEIDDEGKGKFSEEGVYRER